MSRSRYDVAVIGAGIAGCATALALAAGGYKVIIFERRHTNEDRPGETVSAVIRRPLETLHLWTMFKDLNPRPCYATISAWGGPGFDTRSSMIDVMGPGWHIDRRRFDAALWAKVRVSGVVLVTGVTDFSLERGDEWRIALPVEMRRSDRRSFATARFVVDASGRGRALSRKLGHRARRYDRLVGLVGYVRSEEREASTIVEAAPDGWWYSAPLPSQRAVLMYMTDADLLSRAQIPSRVVEDAERFGPLQRFGVTRDEWRPRSFGAATSELAPAAGEGWIAVGDAAAAYDPLSAEGILMALVSGGRGAEAISAWLHGSRGACTDYVAKQIAKFSNYLSLRSQYYGIERRWSERPFWQRRQIARTLEQPDLTVTGLTGTHPSGHQESAAMLH